MAYFQPVRLHAACMPRDVDATTLTLVHMSDYTHHEGTLWGECAFEDARRTWAGYLSECRRLPYELSKLWLVYERVDYDAASPQAWRHNLVAVAYTFRVKTCLVVADVFALPRVPRLDVFAALLHEVCEYARCVTGDRAISSVTGTTLREHDAAIYRELGWAGRSEGAIGEFTTVIAHVDPLARAFDGLNI
jgi:hypothetical protein